MFQNFHAPQHYSPVGHNKVELLVMNNNSDSSRLQPPPPPLRPRKQPLPPGWTEYLDFSSSELYYHNDATGETTWDRPSFPQNNAQPPPPPRRVTTTGTTSSPLPATATNSSFKEVAVSTVDILFYGNNIPTPFRGFYFYFIYLYIYYILPYGGK